MKTLLALIMFTTTTLFGADIVLTWQDNSTNEDGFEVYRKTGSNGAWELIAATNADDPEFVDSIIPIGTTLSYRVRAWNQFGESGYTNTVSVSTFPPTAPSGLSGAAVKSEPVSMVPQQLREELGTPIRRSVSVRTYRDKHGRLVIEGS